MMRWAVPLAGDWALRTTQALGSMLQKVYIDFDGKATSADMVVAMTHVSGAHRVFFAPTTALSPNVRHPRALVGRGRVRTAGWAPTVQLKLRGLPSFTYKGLKR